LFGIERAVRRTVEIAFLKVLHFLRCLMRVLRSADCVALKLGPLPVANVLSLLITMVTGRLVSAESSGPVSGASVECVAVSGSDAVTFEFSLQSEALIGAGQMELLFDPGVLEFSQVQGGELLSSAMLDSNLTADGHLKIAFVASDVPKSTGRLLTVEMKLLSQISAETTLRVGEVRLWKSEDSSEVVTEFSREVVTLRARTDNDQPSAEGSPTASNSQTDSPDSLPRWVFIVGAAGGVTILLLFILLLRRS
jgi:hypothetical protein